VRLYWNLSVAALDGVRCACSARRSVNGSKRPRQHHRRLGPGEVAELVEAYGQEEAVHRLAARFGIHRVTVTALLHRRGVRGASASRNGARGDSSGRQFIPEGLVAGALGDEVRR